MTLPLTDQLEQDAWHLFVIRHPNRDALRDYLGSWGIGTEIHYPIPPHRQPAYAQFAPQSFPISEQLHREVLRLPLNTALTDNEIEYINDKINQFAHS